MPPKFTTNGLKVKELRENREVRATQTEFADEIGISERMLCKIENENHPVEALILDKIAKAFGVHRQEIIFSSDGPRLVSEATAAAPAKKMPAQPDDAPTILPRFDTIYVQVVKGAAELYEQASGVHEVVPKFLVELNAETSQYVEEMVSILNFLTFHGRSRNRPADGGSEDIKHRRRLRELVVMLKGNDVWVYADTHMKCLPESFEPDPNGQRQIHNQLIIAFGPPGEYGEESVEVDVDHGQPIVLQRDPIF